MIKYILFSLIKKKSKKSTEIHSRGPTLWGRKPNAAGSLLRALQVVSTRIMPHHSWGACRAKSALYGQHISLGLFLGILRKEASLPHSSKVIFWSPPEVLPRFFLSHHTYLKLSASGNTNMLQVWPRVLLRCWILKNQLEELDDYLGRGWGHGGSNTAQQEPLHKPSPAGEQPAYHQQEKSFGMSRRYICLTTPLIHQWQKVTASDLPCCSYYLGSCERFPQKYEETLGSGSIMAEWHSTAAWVLSVRG